MSETTSVTAPNLDARLRALRWLLSQPNPVNQAADQNGTAGKESA